MTSGFKIKINQITIIKKLVLQQLLSDMFTSITFVSILMFASTLSISGVQCSPSYKPGNDLDPMITYRDTLVTDEEIYCWSRNSDRFIFSATLESNQCQIKCTFWASSSSLYWKFYNSLDTVHYNKSDNTPCKAGGSNVCKLGVCIDKNNNPGHSILTLENGYFPDQDYFSETDTYIEVSVKPDLTQSGDYVNLGSTRVIEDDNSPHFGTNFTSPLARKTGFFTLVARDRDSSPDDYICSFRIMFNSCKENRLCEQSNGRYTIRYKLKWISQEK